MDGLLLVDKPAGWTSHDAVAYVRRTLGVKKAGHTGTLDPDATGLLLVLAGKATRLARYYEEDGKEYLAVMRLGVETDTQDASGKVVRECPVPELSRVDIEAALGRFAGELVQTPPMYSAVKVGGRPLYKSAREGREVERKPRRVVISAIELAGVEGPLVSFRVACSKGTYVRTLAAGIGAALGSCAHLAALRRTASGDYGVDAAVPLIEKPLREELAGRVIPLEKLLTGLPAISLTDGGRRAVSEGRPPSPDDVTGVTGNMATGVPARLLDVEGALVAMGEVSCGEGCAPTVLPRVVLA